MTLDSDDLAAIAALLLSGGVRLADAVAHGGSAATLTLDHAILAAAAGDTPALSLTGHGAGAGLLAKGGTSGHGVFGQGGALAGSISNATNANPIVITTGSTTGLTTGDAVVVTGVTGNTSANGFNFITVLSGTTFSLDGTPGSGAYAGGGIWSSSSVPTFGMTAIGGGGGGAAIYAVAAAGTHSSGMFVQGDGTGNGLQVQSPDGTGFSVTGGSVGISSSCSGDNGPGMSLSGNGVGGGLTIATFGDSPGLIITNAGTAPVVQIGDGSNIGHGIAIQAGSPGDGINITTILGNTIALSPQDGDGIHIAPTHSVHSAATGISVVGAGTGPAVQLGDGSSGAIGLRILSAPDGTALSIEGDATGMLINGRGGLVITGNDGAGVQIGGTDAPGILVQASLVVSSSMSAVVLAGAGTGSGFDGTLSPDTLASFFLVDTTKVYADAVSGSVVKEIASNAGGGGNPNVILSGTLGDQSLGDVDHVVLPSGPSDNGVLVGSRLRITSGAGQNQERTIVLWDGTNKIAGIDEPLNAVEQAPGDAFQVLYDHSHQLDPSGAVLSIAQVSGFNADALAQFVTLDTTKVATDIAAGSVVLLSRHSIAGIGF